MKIKVDKGILDKLPNFKILAFSFEGINEGSEDLEKAFNQIEEKIREEYSLADVLNIPLIKKGRDSYKKLGIDPSHTRLAAESLYRRIVKGNSVYRINGFVDFGNFLSLFLKRSTAVLDYDKIVGDVLIRLGTKEDEYYGINRGRITVTGLPLYCDQVSPFGSPTSDTERTMVTSLTKRILLFVIKFDEEDDNIKEVVASYLNKFFKIKNFQIVEVI